MIQWGVAARALKGQAENGDSFLVKPWNGHALIAVVDGLGHGAEAAAASKAAVAALSQCHTLSAAALLDQCNATLQDTRGAVMSLAIFDGMLGRMEWAGIGNVEGLLVRAHPQGGPARLPLLLRRGLLSGDSSGRWRTATVPVSRGDTLILATDGIRPGFGDDVAAVRPPQRIADDILSRHALETDDALVLVVRYLGLPTTSTPIAS